MNSSSVGSLGPKVGDWGLRELPARAATFLYIVGTCLPIRARLALGGYRDEDHEEGLRLFTQACALQGAVTADDDATAAAAAALLDWTQKHRVRLRSALRRLHPEWIDLFPEHAPADAPSAALAVSVLLDRLDALSEQAASCRTLNEIPERASTRRSESSAVLLQTLARRGLDDAERKRLQGWVLAASSAVTPPPDVTHEASARMLALYEWHRDWTTCARELIERRDWLIRLGIQRQKSRRREEPIA